MNLTVPENSKGRSGETGSFIPDVIGERFRVKRLLGRGTTSRVLEAHDEILKRNVAIKVLDSGLYLDPIYNQRFEREALALARLSHPNIVSIHDFGYEDYLKTYYLVLELVTGESLERYINEISKSPLEARIDFVLFLLPGLESALTHSHSLNITHRDIKPQNIMITYDGRPVITDFGIAVVSDLSNATLPGFSPGTPIYMSPEQLRGDTVDPRSDIYSLALLIYRILTGRLPFPKQDDLSMIRKRLCDPPEPLGLAFSTRVEEAILRALALVPDQRFQTVLEFSDELRTALTSNSAHSLELRLITLHVEKEDQQPSEDLTSAELSAPSARVDEVPSETIGTQESKAEVHQIQEPTLSLPKERVSRRRSLFDNPQFFWDRAPTWAAYVLAIVLGVYAFWPPKPHPPIQEEEEYSLEELKNSMEPPFVSLKEF